MKIHSLHFEILPTEVIFTLGRFKSQSFRLTGRVTPRRINLFTLWNLESKNIKIPCGRGVGFPIGRSFLLGLLWLVRRVGLP